MYLLPNIRKKNAIVNFNQTNDFSFQRLFRISHILVKKLNFWFSIFKIKTQNIHLVKKCPTENL